MKKFPMYVAILASIALAENLQAQNTNNTHINTQQATLTPDQFYEKIQKTRQNYDYLPVFKKVWNQKRNSVLREPAYKGVIENVIANNEQTYWRDDLDIIILVLGGESIDQNTKNILTKRLAESNRPKPNTWIIKTYNRWINMGIETLALSIEEQNQQNTLKNQQNTLDSLKRLSDNLDQINKTLIEFKKIFDANKQ